MTKFHIAKDGQVKPCKAKTKPCPLKGSHFDSIESAEAYLEEKYSSIYEYEIHFNLGSKYKAINANKRGLFVHRETQQAIDDGLETHIQFYNSSTGEWDPKRAKIHEEILLEVMDKYKNTPNDRKVVFSAGLPGAGKTTVLTQYENLDINEWATISSDDFKELLAKKGLVPELEGLTSMEASTLVHEESSYLADELLKRLSSQGKNLIYDFTCKNEDSTLKRISKLQAYGYETKDMQFVFVDIPIDTAKERAKHRYLYGLNEGLEVERKNKQLKSERKYDEIKPVLGGRFLPEDIIESSKPQNENYSSRNAETLIKLHTSNLGLPEPIIYNNAGTEPKKKDYLDFLISK